MYLGGGFGYYIFGSSSHDLKQDLQVTSGSTVISTIPINLDVTTNNNLLNSFFCVRFKPSMQKFQPYLEAKGGFNYLYTRTKVLDNTDGKLSSKWKQKSFITEMKWKRMFVK